MKTKLTLRLDDGVIRDAKRAARARGVSLSEMVSGYFRAVCKGKTVEIGATPVLAEISGVLSSKAGPKKLIAGYHTSRKNTGEGRPVRYQFHSGHLP